MPEIETPLTEVPQLDEESTSRRHLLGKGAIAAAAATVAGIAMSKSANAVDGGSLIIGDETQTAQTPTTLLSTGFAGNQMLLIDDASGFSASASAHPGALAGWSGSRVGVYGLSGSSAGVVGRANNAGGVGVKALGPAGGVDFEAARAGVIHISAAGVTTTPAGTGALGFLGRDSTGSLWYCYEIGRWRKLAGATTAGSFHPITPVRVYDSRAALPTPGIMAPGTSRVISVKDGRDSVGGVTAADVVPSEATAVSFNVTATGTTGPNFLSVVPGDAAGFTTSNLNWGGAGESIANGGIVKLDTSRQIKVFVGDQSGSTHVIVDVSGFYL